MTLSLREMIASLEIGTSASSVKENEKKWRRLIKYDWTVLGEYSLLTCPSRNLSFRRRASNSDNNLRFASIAFESLKTYLVTLFFCFSVPSASKPVYKYMVLSLAAISCMEYCQVTR